MAPPRPLPEELVEDILLRFPPDDPARLVHAALVCKSWCAIVSGAGFHRRFREFHHTPPLLGFVSNVRTQDDTNVRTQDDSDSDSDSGEDEFIRTYSAVEFVPTCSSLPASPIYRRRGRVVDAHHGRVLLHRKSSGGDGLPWCNVLMVWDPTTDLQEEVPIPAVARYRRDWTAAVLCAAGDPCDHLDCLWGPFLIVLVCYTYSETIFCTYSSSTASWSKPISSNQLQLPFSDYEYSFTQAAHVESALYFGVLTTDHILKFDLESQEISWIQLPTTCSREQPYVLTTTEGGGLELATIHESSKLYMWSRDDVSQVDATWTQSRVIELKAVLLAHAVLDSPRVLGFTVDTGVIFVESNNVLFVIDLKTYKVIKEVSKASEIYSIVPYMSFYTPGSLNENLEEAPEQVLHEELPEGAGDEELPECPNHVGVDFEEALGAVSTGEGR